MRKDSFYYKYSFSIILILLHFCGDIVNYFAILLSSLYLFYYFLSKSKVDLFKIFLLLVPSVLFKDKLEFIDADFSFATYLPKIYNTIIIGPIALSARFILALAVPIKLILTFKKK